jgi:hypothetical protein
VRARGPRAALFQRGAGAWHRHWFEGSALAVDEAYDAYRAHALSRSRFNLWPAEYPESQKVSSVGFIGVVNISGISI